MNDLILAELMRHVRAYLCFSQSRSEVSGSLVNGTFGHVGVALRFTGVDALLAADATFARFWAGKRWIRESPQAIPDEEFAQCTVEATLFDGHPVFPEEVRPQTRTMFELAPSLQKMLGAVPSTPIVWAEDSFHGGPSKASES